MFGGTLSKILGKGASQKGGEALSRVATSYGDDAARSVLGSIVPSATGNVTTKARSRVMSQLKNGVNTPAPINPNIADNFAVEGATNKALPNNKGARAKISNVGKSIEDAGTKLKNNQIVGTIRDRKLLERAPDSIKWAEKYGFNPNQYEDVSNILTGNEGVLANFNNNALRNAKRSVIMPDEARQNALKSVDKAITLEPHVKKNLKRAINDSYDVTTGNISTRLQERGEQRMAAMGEADIFDMHKTVQDLEKMAYEVSGKGADDAQRILRNYANDLKKTINETAKEIYQNPDNVQELTAALEGANLSPQLNRDIIDSIRKGTDYLGIRSMQSPAVTLGKIAQHEKMAPLAGGVGGAGNGLFANPLMQVVNEVVGKPVASATGKALQTGGRAMQMAGRGGAGGAGGGGGSDLLKYGAGALGGYGILNMLTNGGGNADPSIMAAAGMGTGQDNGMVTYEDGSVSMPPSQSPTVGGYTREQLEDAYVAALMDNNAEAADAIGMMVGMLDDKEAKSSKETSDEGTAKRQAGLSTLGTLLQSYERGGGGQGIIGGSITNFLNTATGGAYNPSAKTYSDMSRGAAVQIIKALGESGNLSKADIDAAMSFIPAVTDSDAVAQEKISQLYALLGQ